MANTSSAQKAARQTVKRTQINKSRTSRMKLSVRKVEEAVASGDKFFRGRAPGPACGKKAANVIRQEAAPAVSFLKESSEFRARAHARYRIFRQASLYRPNGF